MSTVMMRALGCGLALAFCGCGANAGAVQGQAAAHEVDRFAYRRLYQPGTTYHYRIVRRYFENDKLTSEEVARSVHTVVEGNPPRERIAFDKLVKTQGADTIDLSAEIAKFPAYEASIAHGAAEGSLELPSLAGWDMRVVGVITDLHTFLVAISPQAGIEHVSKPGDVYVLPKAPIASWANGTDIPVGEDCVQISIALEKLDADNAWFTTAFKPPKAPCLKVLKEWMTEPVVAGTPNNFQQKLKMGSLYGVMWGREEFVVRSKVRRSDGMLVAATMENALALRMKIGCDEALDSCQHEVPVRLRRELSVTLLEGDAQEVTSQGSDSRAKSL